MDDPGAPVIARGGIAGHVCDHPAPDGHDHVAPVHAGTGEETAYLLDRGERLGPLAVGNGEDFVGDPRVDLDPDAVLGDHDGHAGPGRDE